MELSQQAIARGVQDVCEPRKWTDGSGAWSTR